MKRMLILVLTIFALSCGVVVTIVWNRANHKAQLKSNMGRAASQCAAIASEHETDRIQRLDHAELDPNVIRSILQDLKISCEVQTQWKQDKEFLIQVNLDKPLGKTYLVDAIEQSCILYVNRRSHSLLRKDNHSRDVRCLLEANTGSLHFVFRIEPDIPDSSELMVEWANYNPRTREVETLQSKPYVLPQSEVEDSGL